MCIYIYIVHNMNSGVCWLFQADQTYIYIFTHTTFSSSRIRSMFSWLTIPLGNFGGRRGFGCWMKTMYYVAHTGARQRICPTWLINPSNFPNKVDNLTQKANATITAGLLSGRLQLPTWWGHILFWTKIRVAKWVGICENSTHSHRNLKPWTYL